MDTEAFVHTERTIVFQHRGTVRATAGLVQGRDWDKDRVERRGGGQGKKLGEEEWKGEGKKGDRK